MYLVGQGNIGITTGHFRLAKNVKTCPIVFDFQRSRQIAYEHLLAPRSGYGLIFSSKSSRFQDAIDNSSIGLIGRSIVVNTNAFLTERFAFLEKGIGEHLLVVVWSACPFVSVFREVAL